MAKTWKPSKAQQDMLDFVSHEMQYVRSGTREFRTMQSLEKRGLVKYYPRQEYSKNGGVRGMSVWGITEKGKPYVAELVAFMVDFEAKQNAQPATGKVGSDADLLDEDVYIDEPVNSKPLRVVTVDNCCDEVEALIQERDKLLRSEDAYHQENERLRAALTEASEIINALSFYGWKNIDSGQAVYQVALHKHRIGILQQTIDEALADAKPEPKTTRHYVTVMPSIGDKVRIRKAAEQDTEYLINAQKLGAVGVIVGFDGLEVKVEFGSSEADTWMLTFSELEIVELNPYARQSLAE